MTGTVARLSLPDGTIYRGTVISGTRSRDTNKMTLTFEMEVTAKGGENSGRKNNAVAVPPARKPVARNELSRGNSQKHTRRGDGFG